MRIIMSTVAIALTTALVSAPAAAQGLLPFSVEVRAGAAFPTGDFGENEDVETGFGFEVNAKYQMIPLIAVYAGYDRYTFGGNTEGLAEDVEAETVDSGLALGLQASIPLAVVTGLSPWVRGGVIYNQASAEISDGTSAITIESEQTLGFEVGGGLSIPLGPAISVTPGVRYRAYSPEFEFGGETTEGDLSYVAAEVGLSLSF